MNNNKLNEINHYLSDPINFDFLKALNADQALDLRDEPEFDNQWVNSFNTLNKKSFKKEEIELINILREKAFKLSFQLINHFEIASQISDDIEIIAKSFLAQEYNNWAVTHLWSAYKNKKFPV
ncbi:hypothetical protein A9G41_10890 [Gilliamella sp. Nev5-1]|uniref:hypothetical protein n=1 Tax=unclassified Gilliamella TaxID=2685620 RepID=UPI00080D94AE|nr:hypothetical protein [Gilliamella apicola]OCG61359.1 hypothetical protein A9G40_01315 [Gilliamella apicola]OCG67165.1 hypothetical protein A9G41_10890 [Gilliamella apicola]